MFYTTHVNDPIPAAVGCKVLDIVIRENYVENALLRGEQFRNHLKKMAEKFQCIGDIRGRGLMVGLEIVKDRKTKETDQQLASQLASKMMELGLSANLIAVKSFGGVFRMAPPISITEKEMEEGLAILEEAFEEICQ
ncbi:unnamed protein product [[Candida] boidinii]|nr:unnamed protein product [[Candida] boidinii]